MAITTYWDSTFNIKTLYPLLESENALQSPQNIAATSDILLEVPTSAKVLVIHPDGSAGTRIAKIEISDDLVSPFVGSYTVDLNKGVFELPLEGVKRVKITNMEAGAVDVSFMFLTI